MLKDKFKEYFNTESGYDNICNAYEQDFDRLAQDLSDIAALEKFVKGEKA